MHGGLRDLPQQHRGAGRGWAAGKGVPCLPAPGCAAALDSPGDLDVAQRVPPCPETDTSVRALGHLPSRGQALAAHPRCRRGRRKGKAAQHNGAGQEVRLQPILTRPSHRAAKDSTGQVSSTAGADGELTPGCSSRLPAACLRRRRRRRRVCSQDIPAPRSSPGPAGRKEAPTPIPSRPSLPDYHPAQPKQSPGEVPAPQNPSQLRMG